MRSAQSIIQQNRCGEEHANDIQESCVFFLFSFLFLSYLIVSVSSMLSSIKRCWKEGGAERQGSA